MDLLLAVALLYVIFVGSYVANIMWCYGLRSGLRHIERDHPPLGQLICLPFTILFSAIEPIWAFLYSMVGEKYD